MYTKEDMIKFLEAGTSPDTIAKDITNALNEAIKYVEEKKAQEKKNAERAVKVNELQLILDDLTDWVKTYYGENSTSALALDAEQLVDTIDNTIKDLSGILDIFNDASTNKSAAAHTTVHSCTRGGECNCKKTPVKVSAKPTLDEFISKMGW